MFQSYSPYFPTLPQITSFSTHPKQYDFKKILQVQLVLTIYSCVYGLSLEKDYLTWDYIPRENSHSIFKQPTIAGALA